jgi:zinc protease
MSCKSSGPKTNPVTRAKPNTPAFTTATVDFPALDIIGELLFSEAAPLYQELVVKQQIADFISGSAEDHRDPYLFMITARVKDSDALAKVQAAVQEHMNRLKTAPVEAARLRRVTAHLRNRFTQSMDTPDAVADTLSHYLSLTGSVATINEVFRRYQEVTPADIQRVAEQTFRTENETVVTLAQGKTPEVKQ